MRPDNSFLLIFTLAIMVGRSPHKTSDRNTDDWQNEVN